VRKNPNDANMNDDVNNVANAMLKTGAAHVDPDLYLAVMEMPDFSTEALIVAYTHLLENKLVATGFVNIPQGHMAEDLHCQELLSVVQSSSLFCRHCAW
jgi:hypothetical protein